MNTLLFALILALLLGLGAGIYFYLSEKKHPR
jgi:F0F1-type ATP synthase assembly protein I